MIRAWVEDLLMLSDEDWGRYTFAYDPLVGKIPIQDQVEYCLKATSCAEALVHRLQNDYGKLAPEQYAKLLGVNILYRAGDIGDGYSLFACYEEPNTITVFTDNAEATDSLLIEWDLYKLVGYVKTTDLLIAHELYHYLEQTIPDVFTAQKHITLWKIGPFENRSRIICLEEVGAMAFARELIGLKCSPYLFNVIMLYHSNPNKAKVLYESIMSFKETGKD